MPKPCKLTSGQLLNLNRKTVLSDDLLDSLRKFPAIRVVKHCGRRIEVSPLDVYADCPRCGELVKLRAFSGTIEIEDVFDVFCEWLLMPGTLAAAQRRQKELLEAD